MNPSTTAMAHAAKYRQDAAMLQNEIVGMPDGFALSYRRACISICEQRAAAWNKLALDPNLCESRVQMQESGEGIYGDDNCNADSVDAHLERGHEIEYVPYCKYCCTYLQDAEEAPQ